MKKLLTTEEAAEVLGMSYQFLERDRWKGATIPYVRVGSRSIRYRFEDLENYLSSRVVKAVENGNETLQ